MLSLKIDGSCLKCNITDNTQITVRELWGLIEETKELSREEWYVLHNGRLMYEDDSFAGCAIIVPRLFGGKGGFGSMLRAIGAQIEKTTNREACRDLSGRRLRDINEEKRLKTWIEKQSKREEEAAERKRKKLEKLHAEPKHEFKDQHYEQERANLTEKIGDSVEEGFKAAATTSGVKRKVEEEDNKPVKRKTILDLDIDSDELDSSSESDSDDIVSLKKNKGDKQVSNDSGHSSDEDRIVNGSTDKTENSPSEASSDNQTNEETTEPTNAECTIDSTQGSEAESVNLKTEAIA